MLPIPTAVVQSPKREGEGQEYYNRGGSAEGTGEGEGARRRRLSTATATNSAANQFAREPQGQQQTKGEDTTKNAGAGAAESRPAAASAAAAPAGRSDKTSSRSVDGVQGSEAALNGAVGPDARVHGVQMDVVDGEGQAVESDGVVEAVEDKGVEEGEAGGFVVVARDGQVRSEGIIGLLLAGCCCQ